MCSLVRLVNYALTLLSAAATGYTYACTLRFVAINTFVLALTMAIKYFHLTLLCCKYLGNIL